MAKFNTRLKELRTSKDLTQQKLAEFIGISKSSINMYERGEREPGLDLIENIADFFNVDLDYLIGKTDVPNKSFEFSTLKNIMPIKTKKIPLLGEVACGKPIIANSDYEVYVDATTDINADFALKARGDSMINARIFDGDIVFIRKQPDVENGEIAAVIIDDEVTLKRVYKRSDSIMLVAENPKYEPLIYTAQDCVNINILGKAIAFQSDVI